MNLRELVDKLNLQVVCGEDKLDVDVPGVYVSDMLSDVMANAAPGALWITLQVHQNIIAVATLRELAAIVCVRGRQPEADTIEKAMAEGVCLLTTDKTTFEFAGLLWELGLRP